MKLSPHFSLAEATASEKAKFLGVDNFPDQASLERMKYTALKMEVVRQILGDHPIKVNSWYRGVEVNKAVGGVPNSQHAKGEAVDFTAPFFGNPREVALELQKNKDLLGYDQLILEPTWVHISFTSGKPRGNDLTYIRKNHYSPGLV